MRKILVALILPVFLFLAACTGYGTSDNAAVAAIKDGSHVIIDVRTPGEFAAGHIANAKNIDVSAPDFAEQIATLDKGGNYVVYCRSGNRSATAKKIMEEAGFTTILDGGGFDSLTKAGAPTG